MRRTKIVATIGPATNSETAIAQLIAAGVDVFRLNFSHGSRETHSEAIARIRVAAEKSGRAIAILQDLAGPKIRIGTLEDGRPLQLKEGDELHIAVDDGVGRAGRVTTTYEFLPRAVRRGDTLLLDDGHISLRVEESTETDIRTTVIDGGTLGEHKGINAPGVVMPTHSLTPKDVDDLRFGVNAGVDFIALSFVQSADDLHAAREKLLEARAQIPLVAKLERPEAVQHADEVLDASDAIMVARGDLGLEVPLERVPRIQKDLTRRARSLGIPVIVATQVLESMRTEPRPTRAEVSDAASAVDSGVDAIMLAGETAAGAYPIRAVQTLDMIIREAETMPPPDVAATVEGTHVLGGHGRAICQAAVTLAARSDAVAIVAVTRGGKTARLLSALRPRVPVFAATDQPAISRQLALFWGVVPVLTYIGGDLSQAANRIGGMLVEHAAIARGSVIVLVSITPDLAPGPSNFLKLQRV